MKHIISAPLLLTTAIVLDRIVISSTQIGINQSLRPLFILLFTISLVTCAVQYFVRDWHHTQFIMLMVPVVLIAYRSSYSFLKTSFPLQANEIGFGLILVLGMTYLVIVRRKVWRSVRNPALMTTYFNIVCIVLLSFQAVRVGQTVYPNFKNRNQPQTAATPVFGADPKLGRGSTPDIYVIVLDGYARQDVLQDIYKHDNSEFIGWLEERGFYVATESHSNYVQTPYTMASFWNFDYLQAWDSSSEYAQYLYQPIQDNRVFRSLDEIGYTTVSLEGAVHFAEIKDADVYLSKFLPLNNFETLLLIDSPLEPLSNVFDLGIPLQTYKNHRERMLFQLDTLKQIPAEIPGPKIVYTHILAPHPPFVFDQNGNIREQQSRFTLAEGTAIQGSQEEYVNGYQEQVRFINREMMKVIDAILAKSETPPIILVMGDHGPASMFKMKTEAPGCLWERTSNLYAILLPGHQNDGTLYPSISPVNTFRIIFNTYFSTDLPLLEDNSYMMIWYQPTLKLDITDRTNSRDGCITQNDKT